MVRELDRVRSGSGSSEEISPQIQQQLDFPATAPTANPVFFRTYSRFTATGRETWQEVCTRTLKGLVKLGKLTDTEADIIDRMQRQVKAMPSGRWLWVGGSEWLEQPQNFSGAYNCTSTNVCDWVAFALMMDLAMMGCGTGAILEPELIGKLPVVKNQLHITITNEIGGVPIASRQELSTVEIVGNKATIRVGDSRQGWVNSYKILLELSSDDRFSGDVNVSIDLSNVRPAGEQLKGFGGMANPVRLPELYGRCAGILNKANGRQLNSVECCLLIDEAAVTIVAGNIRRCIAHGAKIAAVDGMKPIEEVNVGDRVLTSSGEYQKVTNKFIQGVQDVVEVITSATRLRCTANHRVAVYDGLRSYTWKYAGELQPGDRLLSVPHVKGMPCATTDWAWLVGFFIGDGYADVESLKRRNGGGGEVSFAMSTQRIYRELGEKLIRILTAIGYTPSIRIQGSYGNISVYRKELAQELIKYKKPWSVPVIPEFVWRGNREIRAAFLAGLSDADGTPSRNVLANSNKIEFLREIQRLALSLGIVTTLHERQPRKLPERKKCYEGCHWIHIQGLQSQIVAVGLINQFAVRATFTIRQAKKNGLSLPYQFIQVASTAGWRTQVQSHPSRLIAPSRGSGHRDANWDALLAEDAVNPHWMPLEVTGVIPAGNAETFDIEVEDDHEFIVDGLLAHNSAGMRQFNASDTLGATAKDNLWQQDEHGNWKIDPERDALRMSNHTRVFHHKPTLEECVAAVQKQYYSGEGAIQWAGEAVARSNADLLNTPDKKKHFIDLYGQSQDLAKGYLRELLVAQKNQAK